MATDCVAYERSIDLLRLPRCGTFGVRVTGETECNTLWDMRQRENWMNHLRMAQEQIQSDLAAPLCAQEICGEVHRPRCDIQLRFKPIAYLGQKVYGDWTTAEIVYSGTYPDVIGTAEICDVDYDLLNETNLDFTYPEVDCYEGQLPLQAPCIKRVTCEDETPGLQFIWPACQLIVPDVETTILPNDLPTVENEDFLTEIRYRTWEVDEDLAYSLVGECDCAVCSSVNPTYTLTIADAPLGKVCIEDAVCLRRDRKVRINYATSYNCGLGIDPNLEWAVVLLALTKVGRPQLLCGCGEFDEVRKWWLDDDPSARQPLVTPSKLLYGGTRAGLEVARIVSNEKQRMHFTAASGVGGSLTMFAGNRSFRGKAVGGWA